jgi:hypothetical protein
MTVEQLRNAYSAQPFRPFTIHLADGREVPVLSREFIMSVPSGHTVVVCQPDDTLNIIDLLLITDLELTPGSFLFVAAGQPHRFEEFSADFAVWVFFYGADGGEAPA